MFSRARNGELRDRILHLIPEQLQVPRDRIKNNPTLLTEIGADSLDTVELVMELEEEFKLLDD
jgi:acyl carrier protein